MAHKHGEKSSELLPSVIKIQRKKQTSKTHTSSTSEASETAGRTSEAEPVDDDIASPSPHHREPQPKPKKEIGEEQARPIVGIGSLPRSTSNDTTSADISTQRNLQTGAKKPPGQGRDEASQQKVEAAKTTGRAQEGIRDIARRIASGALVAAGVSTVALLVGGGLAPLIIPAAAGKLTADLAVSWLSGIGSNALASWVQGWADKRVGKLKRLDVEEQLARDLDLAMRGNGALAAAVANLIEKLDALNEVVAELRGKLVERGHFIQRLRDDLAAARLENKRLREWTAQLAEQLVTAQADVAMANPAPTFARAPAVGGQPPTGPPSHETDDTLLGSLLQLPPEK